jgi:hypothetical protein
MLRKIVQGMALVGVVVGVGAVGAGCLDRPVTAQAPTIKTNFTSAVNQSGIDKVDILFDIDNSASMGDKQAYLIAAIPQMISRLVTPNCVDSKGNANGQTASATTGQCTTGTPEFTAVHNMHIGVVTSSLGSRLGIVSGTSPVCDPAAQVVATVGGPNIPAYTDDQGHLINRTGSYGSGPPIAGDALSEGGGFLYWFPALGNLGVNPVAPPSTPYVAAGSPTTMGPSSLIGDFSEIVSGAGESGCGIESQLESWYRFLIQPDPYASIVLNSAGEATWSGVDTTILQQRHDFLRPDSLVAIVVLSDENDSEIDVRSYSGTGYKFMSQLYNPPRATSECMANPLMGGCLTCPSNCSMDATQAGCNDLNCTTTGGSFPSTPGDEWGYNLNLRHVHMPQKYDLNPQFPLTRYYTGLTSKTVPNRVMEYPMPTSSYLGNGPGTCTNPLFAGTLPTASDVPDATSTSPAEIGTTLCTLTGAATRTAGDVFYAHIGGVPHELLQNSAANCTAAHCTGASTDPASCATDCAQKAALAPADWVKILGTSGAASVAPSFPIAYDYTGIDPHMIESMSPRNMLPAAQTPASVPAVSSLAGPTFAGTAWPGSVAPDPVNGREWTTTGQGASNAATFGFTHSLPVDREYACIFQLPLAQQRDCALLDPSTISGNSCDCTANWQTGSAVAPANPVDQVPPLCSKTSTPPGTNDTGPAITSSVNDYTVQVAAKAYPTIRELTLANMMPQGQGIVSSLCPIHTIDNAAGNDPLYGYRPAVNAIVNRLKTQLGAQCVPQLSPQPTGDGGSQIPCLILVSAPKGTANFPASSLTCKLTPGYANVDETILSNFNMEQMAAAGDAGASADLANDVTCSLNQISVLPGQSCPTNPPGWCYVTGAAISGGSTCTQEIAYSSTGVVPNGATINLQCVAQNTADAGTPRTQSGDGG